MSRCLPLVAILCLAAAPVARAQDQPGGDKKVFTEMSEERTEAFLKGLGFEITKMDVPGAKVVGIWRFKLEGYTVLFLNYGSSLQLRARFEGKELPLAKANEWNASRRFTKVYVDLKEKLHSLIESDLPLEGGVTNDAVEAFIKRFRGEVNLYARYIREVGVDPSQEKKDAEAKPPGK
jgi:hypothetical protein